MAITKAVSVVSIVEGGEDFKGDVLIGTVNLLVKDDAVELINEDFSVPYKKVDDKTVDEELAVWGAKVVEQMQQCIDTYVNEQAMLNNSKLATEVSSIESTIDVTGIGV